MRTLKLLLASLALVAVPAAGRADTKIGVIDTRRMMDEIDEAKAVAMTLKKEMDDREQKFSAKRAELDKAAAEYDKQVASGVLNDEGKKAKTDELQRRSAELQQLYEAMQKELAVKDGELRGPLDSRLGAVVKEVADAEGITVVLSKEVVSYAAPSLDITNEVVRKYNTKYPRKAGAAAAGDAKPKPAGGAGGDTKPKAAGDKPAAKPK
jgi:outer membrane protein